MSAPGEYVDRGVYQHPFTDAAGTRWLVAVNSRGWRVAELAIPPGCLEPADETARLWRLLDEVDPEVVRPTLHVLSGGAR